MSILVLHSNYLEMLLNYPWKEFLFFSPEYLMWFEQRDVPRRETRPERETENKSGDLIHDVSASVLHTVTECGSHFHSLLLHNDTTDNSAANNTTHYCWCFHPHTHTLQLITAPLSHTHIHTARWLSQWTLAFGTACPLWLVAVGNWLFTITLWGHAVDREAVITYALPPRHRLYPAQSDFPLELFLASSENSDDGARRQNEFVCSQGGEVNYFHPSQTYTKQTSKKKKKKMWVCFWVSYFLVV